MNERRLKELLREVPVPAAEEAERRGLRIAEAAFAQRQPARRTSSPRLALALVIAALLAALFLSPAGAAVRDWIDDALTVGVRDAEPALTEVPGGGRLLVSSSEGPWVVQADGSRRLLGSYGEATWSPRGLFVAAASGHALSALEPDGTVRWSLSANGAVADPRWSPSGVRIAYRAGNRLRVVVGDGSGDRLLDRRVAPVPPAWWPQGTHLLAYVGAVGELRVVDADRGAVVGSAEAAAATRQLAWAPDGSRILEATPASLLLREVTIGKLASRIRIGPSHPLPLPPGAALDAASFSPRDGTIAALLRQRASEGPVRSEVVLIDPERGSRRQLFAAPGRLSGLAWSPDGRRLLIAWPGADQWLFVPANGRSRVRAIDGIAAEFSPGATSRPIAFPHVEGWCCSATAGR